MPTRTTVDETFEGQSIQCAKFESSTAFRWKAAQVVQAATDYEFQFAVKAASAATLTIQVGDSIKTQAVTTTWTRYVIDFPSVTKNVNSLYIDFPAGTYYIYNVQLERATTPSAWRPAPEDAEDYAHDAAQLAVDAQTQLDVFNKLTDGGRAQGLYILDGQLYVNGEYIAAKTISADKIYGGTLSGAAINIGDGIFKVDQNGKVTAENLNITGGAINIDTTTSEATDYIKLGNQYAGVTYTNTMSARYLTVRMNAGVNGNYYTELAGAYLSGWTDGNSKPAFSVSNGSYGGELKLYNNSSNLRVLARANGTIDGYASDGTTLQYELDASLGGSLSTFHSGGQMSGLYGGTITLYDSNGTRRVLLNSSGLNFYNSSGTLTKTYSAT